MIDIRPLTTYDREQLAAIATGYTAAERYRVCRDESDARISLTLELEPLPQPYAKTWEWRESDHEFYRRIVADCGCSIGAYDGDALLGVAIAEPRPWFEDLCVWELHVREGYRGRGIGWALIERLADWARVHGLRMIVCETQNTNVPAIRFYRRVGFEMAGIDVWFYPPEIDEVALFMKRLVDR